eukprot:2079895-Amphidinium_carterae.1
MAPLQTGWEAFDALLGHRSAVPATYGPILFQPVATCDEEEAVHLTWELERLTSPTAKTLKRSSSYGVMHAARPCWFHSGFHSNVSTARCTPPAPCTSCVSGIQHSTLATDMGASPRWNMDSMLSAM